jgi:hypothetical protein
MITMIKLREWIAIRRHECDIGPLWQSDITAQRVGIMLDVDVYTYV